MYKRPRAPLTPVQVKRRKGDAEDDEADRVFRQAYAVPYDIILLSNDDISFYIESMYLKVHSHVLRDALSIPQPPPDEHSSDDGASEIPIDATAVQFRLLLDCFRPDRVKRELKWECIKGALSLAEMLDCPSTIDRLIATAVAQNAAFQDCWDCFVTFARYDCEYAARYAIAEMEYKRPSLDFEDFGPELVDSLPSPYFLGLMFALRRCPRPKGDSIRRREEWHRVAQRFEKIPYLVSSDDEYESDA